MAPQFIYTMRNVGRFYPPDRQVLEDITLAFYPGAKIGVLGSNGSGKSSLLRIMAGVDDGYVGEARLSPEFSVGLLEQEPKLDLGKNVYENVLDGAGEIVEALNEYETVLAEWSSPDADYEKLGARQSRLEDQISAANGWDLQRSIDIAMDALQLPPKTEGVEHLSGGEIRRVALCRLLLSKPDLLLLDEPTNHLDATSVAWLERHLSEYEGTVVAITHDRYFLDNVAGWILELERGKGLPFEGNYSSWLEQKKQRLKHEEKKQTARQRTLDRELEWVQMSPKARQSKGKARLSAYESLMAEAQAYNPADERVQIHIPPGKRLGDKVIEVSDLSKAFGDKKLINELNFSLPPAGIVGVIGGNGAGKTTLFKMLVAAATGSGEQADNGKISVGSSVELAYVDQSRDELNSQSTVYEAITDGQETIQVGGQERNGRAYVASFNFKGSDQQKKVGVLSGGERNRVQLAKVLKTGGNVLMLDEPTNDLDVDTLRALEDALERFPGCAVVISHDRWFLDRIATHILSFEGDEKVRWFEGNYSQYEAFRANEEASGAEGSGSGQYKPLQRQ